MPSVQFWQIASGLGVGAFLGAIFYGIVRHFGRRKGEGFETSRLTPTATAIVAILIVLLGAAITIVGLVLYQPEPSTAELLKSLERRHKNGDQRFKKLKSAENLSPGQRKKIDEIYTRYTDLTEEAKDALRGGEPMRYHEATKGIFGLLMSDGAKVIPQADLDYLRNFACHGPLLDDKSFGGFKYDDEESLAPPAKSRKE